MEDVLDVYELPYDKNRPVVCMDGKPYQLPGAVREPLPPRPGGHEKRTVNTSANGACSIFVFTPP
ncbi:MAG: hypothetical protein LBG57_13465 [Treponema sp.]|nr:hypothetical protein [Treponema sp.]